MQNTIFWLPRMNFMSWHGVEGPSENEEKGERQNNEERVRKKALRCRLHAKR